MLILVIVLSAALVVVLGLLVWVLFRKPTVEPVAVQSTEIARDTAREPMAITAPSTEPAPASSPVVEGGELSPPSVQMVEVRPPLLPPVILQEPEDQQVFCHGVAVFRVRAKGEGLSFQWQLNGQDIEGAVDPFLIKPNVDLDSNGSRYAVRVRNGAGSVTSREAVVQILATHFVTGDPENPFIQISRWSQRQKLGPEIQSNEQLKLLLGNLLEKAPSLALGNAMVTAPSLLVMRLSPELMQSIASGTAQMMLEKGTEAIRGNVVQGRVIIGQASFLNVSNSIKAAGAALAIWQVMAMITAQKFLSDINRRLAGIERGIQDLKEWLEEDALSSLSSDYRYLSQAAASLGSQSLSIEERMNHLNQVDDIDRNCAKLQDLFHQRSLAALEQFRTQDVQGLGLKDNAHALLNYGPQYLRMHYGYLNALKVRCAAAQVRLSLPANPKIIEFRLIEIRKTLTESQIMARIFSEIARDQVGRMKGRFSKDKTDASQRERVKQALEPDLTHLRNVTEEIDTGLGELEMALRETMNRFHRGMEIAVELDASGEVLRVNQVTA